jgi:hypothetical protein
MLKISSYIVVAILCVFALPQSALAACPCSIWSATSTPGTADSNDPSGVELGTKFRADESGYITGVRFFKSVNNTGIHVGSIWSTSGTRLASATFTSETSSGWQQVSFSSPVAITAGTTYIVSYYAPNGHYAFDSNAFATAGVDNGLLHALANGVNGGNGVYTYGTASAFPTSSYNSSNYWVDVVYLPNSAITAPVVSSTLPAANATGASLSGPISATFNHPMDATTMTSANFTVKDSANNTVAGVVSFNGNTSTLSFTPNPGLNGLSSYTATVKGTVRDSFGLTMGSDFTWTFTTAAAPPTGNCPCSIWPSSTTPSVVDSGDGSGIELGVKFRVDYSGYITGVRFYKSAQNTGAHVGNLWTTTGTKLASVTFTNESGSGWQQANFSTPVPISAGTTYIVSYFAPNGHYAYTYNFFASSGVDNAPVHALGNGVDGGNGVYTYGATSAFPGSTFSSGNYWVDAVYVQTNSTTAPIISSTTPLGGATKVSLGGAVRARFNQTMDAASLTAANFVLKDSANNTVGGTVSYDAASAEFSFQPASSLGALTVYTATVKGAVRNFLGNAMGSDYSWSFTTSRGCPCTIWDPSSTPVNADSHDGSGVELGVKFRADFDGYIMGVRFYKSAANTGAHIGSLWNATGTRLATATFTGESTSGWQQVLFSSPVPVTAGTTYVASYYAPVGHYAFDQTSFNNAGVDNIPLHAFQSGTAGGNGVYAYSSTSAFPTSSYNGSNYWVDVVYFQGNVTTPPSISTVTPTNGATGVNLAASIAVSFTQPMDPASITASALTVLDPSNNAIPGALLYDPGTFTITFQPNPQLAAVSTYKATLSGTVRNINGVALGSNSTWTFTTTTAPPPTGPGGPVLVITTLTNPYTQYLSEILLAEGLNAYTSQDIAGVTSSVLANYDVVILGDMKLTPTQVTMFTTWVNNGGNLIALHPDKQLATLLGLTTTTGTLANTYLAVTTSSAPGLGIVSDTIQFHGSADLYNLSGATMVARLYSNATTSTSFPAVTWKNSGAGRVAAFTYDLARSIVYTRQGNPAWAGRQRIPFSDSTCPGCATDIVRTGDMFFGNASYDPQPDWVNLSKVQIPQADEQQRLLLNLVEFLNLNRKPLPRFWYLPSGFKAAVIMTGDDHNNGGTAGRFNQYIDASPAGCSVADWTCVRATSYVFPFTSIPGYNTFVSSGFEIANHVDNSPSCTNFTPESLEAAITSEMGQMATNYPGLPVSKTNRTHCVVWSDYDSQPKILLNHGIRLDTSYYYWPQQWILDRPGMFTGSGFPMRYADLLGKPIDVYQATTQMPDESNQTFPMTIDTLLDNALGSKGFYGVFTANMHTDQVDSPGSDAIVDSAQARGVPIISSLQMLTWLDGRNTSKFSSLSWASNRLNFTITAGTGARNLQAMVPARSATNGITSITRNGSSVSFTRQTIKGIQYAVFTATAGTYQATYTSF